MAFDASKTLLLEKQYLYVRASKGFQLEGVSTERIWTNTGYYRFLVSNVAYSLGNSYVTIHYDSTDIDFIAYCSDLFMEELQNSIVVAVENLESYLQQFAETNHDDIETFSENVGTALNIIASKNNLLDFNSLDYSFTYSNHSNVSISLDVGSYIVFYVEGSMNLYSVRFVVPSGSYYIFGLISDDGEFTSSTSGLTSFTVYSQLVGRIYKLVRLG